MKLKRAKMYRRLMHLYEVNFGFREPYQVLLDSRILEDAYKFKIDIISRLEGVLQGKVKPMITQCDIRHLYNATPKNETLINQAKQYERRRCNHHELEEPLSTHECLSAVVDPKDNRTNKNRYVVASQDPKVRAHMRKIAGVPLIYISKSVMIMEPMGASSEDQREAQEKTKFRAGLKGQRNPGGQKRKREDDEGRGENGSIEQSTEEAPPRKKKNRAKGPKQPNPLSVKKPQKALAPSQGSTTKSKSTEPQESRPLTINTAEAPAAVDGETSGHRKRKRKHKPKGDGDMAIEPTEVDQVPDPSNSALPLRTRIR